MIFGYSSSERHAMSGVDTAWLRMESPTNLMMITGVMVFAERIDFAALKQTLRTRFLRFKRFKCKAVDTGRSAYWETDPYFDLSAHVHRRALPGRADKEELQELVSELASTSLDPNKPMWQFHLIENYRGGSALVLRIHHCYADGLALVQVMLSLTDAEPSGAAPDTPAERAGAEGPPSLMRAIYGPASELIGRGVRLGLNLWEESTYLMRDPGHAVEYARKGADAAGELAKIALLPAEPETSLRGPLGVRKRCAWAEQLSLDEVKAIARLMDCTVNDVLLSAVAGALGSYLADAGERIEGLSLRASVPVNLRTVEDAKRLGNQFGIVFMSLPIGIANPVERLYQVRRDMRQLKRSTQPAATLGLLNVVGAGPSTLQKPLIELFSSKASTVMTNVPGPQYPLYLAGARMVQPMFWVPQTGSIGMGISVLSYAGTVQFGLISDVRRLPDPEDVVHRFQSELEKLVMISMMEPWDEPVDPGRVEVSLERKEGEALPGLGVTTS